MNFHVWVHIESNWNIPFSFMDKLRQTIECGFNLKLIRDIIITYSQMHCTDKYLQNNSIIWPVWLNDWVFVYKLSGCGFKFRCSHVSCYFMKKLFFFSNHIIKNYKYFLILSGVQILNVFIDTIYVLWILNE